MVWWVLLCALLSLFVGSALSEMTATTYPKGIVLFVVDITKDTTFSCEVTGADGANWIVDNISAEDDRIRAREITLFDLEALDEATRSYRLNISVPHTVANRETELICEADNIMSEDFHSSPVLLRAIYTTEEPQGMTVTDSATKLVTTITGNELNL